ncbi:MAG: arginine deiminase family protein [Hyphomicrobiales bacterium]
MSEYGGQSMAGKLTRVLMRRPNGSLLNADAEKWHYNHCFNAEKAIAEYEVVADLVSQSGIEIIWIEDGNDGLADAMFTRDASLMTDKGVVLLRMGKTPRADEPALHGRAYRAAGIPVIGRLSGEARAEGGDIFWLDENTLAVGLGFRSNAQGVRQLNALLNPHGISVLGFDMPVGPGPDHCLHLTSVISPLSHDKYLVHPPLIPAPLWIMMRKRGIDCVAAPEEEFSASLSLNLNVLALAPDDCIMIDGFPKTKKAIEETGARVRVFPGQALCMGCEGGPTCLSNAVRREV